MSSAVAGALRAAPIPSADVLRPAFDDFGLLLGALTLARPADADIGGHAASRRR
jgi:hypothetical protein